MRFLVLAALSATVLAAAPKTEVFGQLPLYFEPNRGQAGSGTQFLARGGGISMLLGDRETVLATRGAKPVKMTLEGSRKAAFQGLDPQPGVSHYYLGNDPAKWLTAVPHFAKVTARGVYEGIDLVYYGNPHRIEYDFIVAPGADPGVIRLAYEGADKIRLDDRGDLVLTTGTGELRQHKPRVYQEIAGRRVEIAASYRLRGTRVGFELARYDPSAPVVIDPALSYGSLLGGSLYDRGTGIGLDSSGAIYVAGSTASVGFPTQVPVDSLQELTEAFVTKLSPDGKSLIYSTYLGGSAGDDVGGFSVQASGNVFVTGSTNSSNFPTNSGYQMAFANPASPEKSDAFLAKLGPAGTLVYATYLGGTGNDYAIGLAIDAAGNAFVAGATNSSNFPGSVSSISSNQLNGFISKIGPAGNMLAFTAILGGSGPDYVNGIALDASGIYVTGETWSFDFPVTPGVVQPALSSSSSGWGDAFVAKIRPDGSGLLYSTYVGWDHIDSGRAIAVDGSGNAYVTGVRFVDYPINSDVFVVKLNANATALTYTASLGGPQFDQGNAIVVDSTGRATIAGIAGSGLLLIGAWQSAPAGGFLARLNASGTAFEYSTYVGSWVSGVFLDSTGATWATGSISDSCCGPATPVLNGYDMTPNGTEDAFIAKFVDQPAPISVTISSNPAGRSVIVDGRTVTTPATFVWQPGSPHTLDASAPQVANAIVYEFASWSHGGSAAQSFTAGNTTTYTVTYTPLPCTYSLAVTSRAVGFEGSGPEFVRVFTGDICPWTARSNAAWLVPTPFFDSGDGNRPLGFQVDPNLGPPRTGTITVGNSTLTVTQSGGSGGLAAPVLNAPPSGLTFQTRAVTVSWNAVPGAVGYDMRILKSQGGLTVGGGVVLQGYDVILQGSQMGANATSATLDLAAGGYLFFVRACRDVPSDSTCGSFAATGVIVNLTAPSQAPVILSPASGQTLTSSTQEFRWQPIAGADRYQVTLRDSSGSTEMQINTPATSTIYSMRGSPSYRLRVAACQAACGPESEVSFNTNLAAVPASAPAISGATAPSPTSYRINWSAVAGADIYRIAVVQPNTGPGGGALTVASTQTAVPEITLTVPPGPASVIVAACTGRGCGPYSAPFAINPPGPAPGTPVIGQPISVTNVDGPLVLFTWSRIPGDNGSNTTYRLYSADLSRNATALDVLTANNFYAGLFAAEGRRYDVVVAANPGPSQTISAPVGFVVQGNSSPSPTPTAPTHEGTVKAGNVQIGWGPVSGAYFYQYSVFKIGDSAPTATGMTPGLFALVPLSAQGAGTRHSMILRACTTGACKLDSDAGWGPWSNAPGGPGVTNFTVVP